MIPCKFPLSDVRRQNLRDDRLWVREVQRLTFFNLRKMHCPCSKYQGRRKLLVRTVRKHLILNERDPNFRVWRGPSARDSSDEEWEGHMRTRNQQLPVELDSHVDTRGMVDNAFLEPLCMKNATTVKGKVTLPIYPSTGLHHVKMLRVTKLMTTLTLQC
jgi:hypothetical protein